MESSVTLKSSADPEYQHIPDTCYSGIWIQPDDELFDEKLPAYFEPRGIIMWIRRDQVYRDDDLPAIIHTNGTREWYQNDELHRDHDLPAVIRADGSCEWYKRGVRYHP